MFASLAGGEKFSKIDLTQAYLQLQLEEELRECAADDEHFHNLEEVLVRLRNDGIRVKSSKCTFFQGSIEYLGHKITNEGLHTTTKKVDAVHLAPAPNNQHELRSFQIISRVATLLWQVCA